ncbi:MAG: proton-conducting transporter transmembrane domain-containing protein, partial [bacterium]
MSPGLDPALLAVLLPALGALVILAIDLGARSRSGDPAPHRADALAGIRMGAVAALFLAAVWIVLPGASMDAIGGPDGAGAASGVGATGGLDAIDGAGGMGARDGLDGSGGAVGTAPPGAGPRDLALDTGLRLDALGRLGLGFLSAFGLLVVSLALTHFGMARSRPAEPLALLLLSITGLGAALLGQDLLVVWIGFELGWLPLVALIALDSRRLSSSESSLKLFYAHGLASLLFALGLAFVFGATGRLDWEALGALSTTRPLLLEVGIALVLAGLLARSVVAPFHPWSPDVHEGAASFVTTHIATAVQATSFVVLLRMVHGLAPFDGTIETTITDRVATLLGSLGALGLIWGHAMALVQVGLRRLLGWLGVGQAGFFALALVEARGDGASALLFALLAASLSAAGVLALLSSLSHHERACEHVGDLSGMMKWSPLRAALLALFLLSLAGFPGTIGFVARLQILAAVEHGGHRGLLVVGLVATVLALAAVGRPLLAMLRPVESRRDASRALTNEQLVLALCGAGVIYLGLAPLAGDDGLAALLREWILVAV